MRLHRKIKKIFGFLLLLVLLFCIACAVYLWMWDQKKQGLPVADAQYGNELRPIGDDLLFLLAGIDHLGADEPTRTDTLMLVRLNFAEGKIAILSIPRDTRCMVAGEPDKINHAHAYGGMPLTLSALRSFLRLDIDYYIEVNYEAVKAVIEAGGGVQYAVPEGVSSLYDGLHLHSGDQHMNGEQALAYLRHRESYDMGDLGRVAAQQAFLKAALKQLLSPWNFYRYPLMGKAMVDHCETNIPALKNIGLLFKLGKLHLDQTDMRVLPGEGVMLDDISYYLPYEEELDIVVDELFAPYRISTEAWNE